MEKGAWGERTYSPAQGSGFSRDHAPPESRGTLNYLLLPSAGQVQLKKEALKQPPHLIFIVSSEIFLPKEGNVRHRAVSRGGLKMCPSDPSQQARKTGGDEGEAHGSTPHLPASAGKERTEPAILLPHRLPPAPDRIDLSCIFQSKSESPSSGKTTPSSLTALAFPYHRGFSAFPTKAQHP